MTVLSHLTDTASKAVLSSTENSSIATSVSTLQERLNAYFGTDISSHFKFGSYTRDTILPRRIDEHSDVDYMVVFADTQSKPQTYLDRFRRFVETKYARSEIFQSHPTIVLSLSHIKFELIPAVAIYGGYNIPAPASNWQDWIATSPNAFNATLTDANKRHGFQIKPLVRLCKYWNALSGYVFDSFSFEQHLVNTAYSQPTLKEYFFAAFDNLTLSLNEAQWRKDKLARAKEIVNNTRQYDREGKPVTAEIEIKKLVPAI